MSEHALEVRESSDFIKVENNLETLGFFSPSSRQLRKRREKVITFKKRIGGETQEVQVTIMASGNRGLPVTIHQDLFRAFQSVLTEVIRREGKVGKHVTFTSAELLSHMGKSRGQVNGKLYREVEEWLEVMRFTGVKVTAKGAVWNAGEKRWITRMVTVFDDVVCCGRELADGTVADTHHVWLSDWQLGNINAFYLMSINYELYKLLNKNIAKSLFSILHSWFYVGKGKYSKGYAELSQWLGITEYTKLSRIKQQLDPSHEELRGHGFIKSWKYRRNPDRSITIQWVAGERYYEDKRRLNGFGEQLKLLDEPEEVAASEEAVDLVTWFHGQRGARRKPTGRELEKADEMIGKHGLEASRFVAEFALKEARKTGFQMRDFGAVTKIYKDEGLVAFSRWSGVAAQEAESQQQREDEAKKEAIHLVKELHRRVGRLNHRPSRKEIDLAEAFIKRNGVGNAERIVESVVLDAREIDFSIKHFGHVEEVMDRVVCGG